MSPKSFQETVIRARPHVQMSNRLSRKIGCLLYRPRRSRLMTRTDPRGRVTEGTVRCQTNMISRMITSLCSCLCVYDGKSNRSRACFPFLVFHPNQIRNAVIYRPRFGNNPRRAARRWVFCRGPAYAQALRRKLSADKKFGQFLQLWLLVLLPYQNGMLAC